MRFIDFLNEEARKPHTQPASIGEAIDWANAHAKRFVGKMQKSRLCWLWRGQDAAAISIGDSSTFRRKSLNSQNYYTQMIASSPKWKDYPSRERSFICSSNFKTAMGFGELNLVIPADDAHLGICPRADIWPAFEKRVKAVFGLGHGSLNSINMTIHWIGRKLNMNLTLIDDNQEFRKTLRSITRPDIEQLLKDQIVKDDDLSQLVRGMHRRELKNLEQAADWILDPGDAGFKQCKATEYTGPSEGHSEVWIGGKALFLDFKQKDKYGAVMDALQLDTNYGPNRPNSK